MSNDVTLSSTTAILPALPDAGPEKAVLENSLTKIVQTYLTNFLSKHTQEAYTRDFRDFSAFLVARGMNVVHPKEIQKEQIIAYRDHLRERYTPTSINRKLSALSSLFEELVGTRQLNFNPVEGVRRPPATVTRPRLGFTDQEVNQILDCHSTETLQGLNNRALLAFLFFTGCRISEALAVRVSDIENLGNVQVARLKGKGEKRRTLPLHPKLSKLVLELIQRRGKKEGDFLFTRVKGATGEGGPLLRQNVGKILKRTLKRLGLDTNRSLHSSRRTVISNLLHSGARIESVAELAGHANINTTQRYNVRKEELEDNPLLSLRYND